MKKKSSEESTSSKTSEKKNPTKMQTSDIENQSIEQKDLLSKAIDPQDVSAMLEDSISAIFMTIPSGKLIYCNKAFLDLFGFKTREEAFNYPVQKLYPSTAARENFLNELKKNKKLEGYEAVHVSVNGSVIHTLENMVGVFDDSGKLIKIMGNLVDISERKKAEKALRESENRYRELIELAADGILLGSHEGIIIGANSQMQKLTGRTLDQLIGKYVGELFSSDELNKVPLRFDLLMKGETVFSERSIIRPDGSLVPIEMNTKMMPDGTYHSIYRDISERRITEKALIRSEEKYRKTFYISPDAININRLEDGKYISINSGFAKITGYSESDIIGKTSLEVNIWADPEDRKKLVETLKKDGVAHNLDARFRNKNGKILFGLMSASIIELDGVPHIISITRDITERKQAEESLQKSESKLQAIFSAMTDVILVVDSDGRYLEIAPSNPSLLYKPPKEILGRTMHEIFPKEQADFFLNSVRQCLTSHEDVRMEYPLEIDGRTLWFAAVLSRLSSNSVLLVARDITETKLAEEKLKISDATYRGILNTINEAIYIQDKDGTFLDVNEGAVRMYGYSREELIGKNPLFVSAEGKNNIQKVIEQVKLAFEDIPQEFEFWGKRKNGQIFPKLVRVYKGVYFEKEIIIAVAQDISERKQAEQKLEESEELFRNLVENISDVFYIVNKQGIMKYCSPNFFALTGFLPMEILGHYYVRIIAPVDRKAVVEHYNKETKRGVLDTNLEVRVARKDGQIHWVEQNSRIVRDEKGEVLEYRNVARDITARKLAEDALKKSEEWFRNLFEKASDGIFHLSLRGEILAVNKAFALMHGYSVEEMQKMRMSDLDTPETSILFPERIRRIVAGENLTFEVEHYHKNGHLFPLEVSASIITVGDEKFILAFHRDITKRKQDEEELRSSEERFRLISNLTSDYLFATKIDEDGTVELDWATGAFEKITGYTVEEYTAVGGWRAVVHPDDRDKDLMDFQNLQRNEKVISEVRTIQKNGNVVWTRSYAHPIWDEKANRLIGIYGAAQDITEQKSAEEELRKSELHFRSVWENSASGMRLTDENGKIIAVNSAFCQIIGKNKNELEGFELGVIYPEAERERIQLKHKERFRERTVNSFVEKELLLWNGKKVWFRVANSFIESDGEKPLLLGVFTDVTEQKLSEGAIKKLSQAVEQSAGSITITDINGNIEYVNKKFEEISGYSFQEIKGKNARILKSGGTTLKEYKKMWETITAGNEWRGTFHNKRKDGSLYWEATTISPMKNSEGVITNFLAIKDDITQDKIKEEQLTKSELHFRSIWENSLDGMRLTDENGIIVSVNDAFARLFQKDKSEIIGSTIDVVYGKDSGFNDVTSFCHHFIKRTVDPFMDREITLWNDKPMSIELTNSFVEIEGQPTLLLSIFRDVTEKKQTEREITSAKEKAEEANKVKTNFLENMSHELRTPMIPILGFTELMAAMELPEEVKNMATMMNKGANRLMDTLNIILDLAQIEKERVLLKPVPTDLHKTVDEVCGLFQPIAKERNLYLRSEFLTGALTVNTDARILRHALNNLINNGLKFTPNGGVTIKLSAEKSGDQNFAIIQVCDTGIGIPKDKQNIIWEEFRQASEGIGRSFEGNGLGLTITKNFIEQLKGEVGVESEVGKGSTFTIRLPYVENLEENKPIPKETVVQPAAPIVKQEVKPDESLLKKVLYVEDEEISFSVVKHFLKNKVSLDWARNGQDGVVMAKGNKYKAILMDINLAKGIDGMQTTKLIRELPQYEKTPIIAITAFAMRGDKEEFLGAGCSHYISKPFTKASLLNLMGEALGEKLD